MMRKRRRQTTWTAHVAFCEMRRELRRLTRIGMWAWVRTSEGEDLGRQPHCGGRFYLGALNDRPACTDAGSMERIRNLGPTKPARTGARVVHSPARSDSIARERKADRMPAALEIVDAQAWVDGAGAGGTEMPAGLACMAENPRLCGTYAESRIQRTVV